MIKVLIADDDLRMRLIIKNVLSQIDGVNVIGEAENGNQLVKMVKEFLPDVVFIDIDMPQKDGIAAAKEIFKFEPKICIIFANDYPKFVHETYEVYAFDYLLKPFRIERIKKTMERIISLKYPKILTKDESIMKTKLLIPSNGIYKVVFIDNITYITREGRKTIIHTNNEKIKCYESLQKLESQLPTNIFFRCHQGFIINTNMIREIESCKNKVYAVKLFSTDDTVLMTAEKLKEFKERFSLIT